MKDVTVMKVISKSVKAPGDWAECIKLCKEIESLSGEIENVLNVLAKKHKELHAKTILAYKAAPLTDCGFGDSLMGAGRVNHAIKNHLYKHDMRVDNHYVSDVTKIVDFSKYIKDVTRWLLQFS